jgi:PPOX class probable F420-dependent enzyme
VPTLSEVDELRQQDRLVVVSTLRSDSSIQSSVVAAGVLPHPISGNEVVGFVTYGRTKLGNLRARPQLNVSFRAGGRWIAVEGTAELIGPDDPNPEISSERLRLLLREVFTAAGGTHDDWEEYDRVMADDRRVVVLVAPSRIYSNRPR